jgi:hypothetical protein
MSVALDGQNLFDGQEIQIEPSSVSRDSVERAVPGLDGVLSIDLGARSRKIRQRGVLRAGSRSQLNDRISVISAHMDGDTHRLVTQNGDEFDNLRIDAFEVKNERASGSGVAVDYEIVYTQMAV